MGKPIEKNPCYSNYKLYTLKSCLFHLNCVIDNQIIKNLCGFHDICEVFENQLLRHRGLLNVDLFLEIGFI